MTPRITRRAAAAGLAAAACAPAVEEAPAIVATFSILGDLVAQIAGDTRRTGAEADAHIYEPTPADAAAIAAAPLLVANGLGFEPWLDRLTAAAGFAGVSCTATAGILVLRHGGVADPHAWHNVSETRRYARNIAAALTAAFPTAAAGIAARADALDGRLAALDRELRQLFDAIPAGNRVVATSHSAFGYFQLAYNVRFLAPLGLSTDSEPRPDRVAALIDQIRAENVRALFLEAMADDRLLAAVARETGVRIGGRLYGDSLSGPDGPAATYESFMRHNANALAAALT
jgi:zinc/manganese transport system substrate-binding protein